MIVPRNRWNPIVLPMVEVELMSWTASGRIGTDGTTAVDDSDFQWSPPYDSLAEGPREQAEFCLSIIEEAFQQEAIEGEYSVSMGGHAPDPNSDVSGSRKSLAISFSPVEAAQPAELASAENVPGTDNANASSDPGDE